MTTTNKATMDAMMERMNALVAGGVGRCPTHKDKESTPTVVNDLPTSTGAGTTQPKRPKRCKCICPHCKRVILYKPENCVELKVDKDKRWPGWKLVHTIAWQTPGTNKVDLDKVATKIVLNAQLHTSNYWSLLACLVKEQEAHAQEYHTKGEMAMIAIADGQPTNKVAPHWARKLANRTAHHYAFLDSGVTSRAAPEEDEQDLDNTGNMPRKTFMFPDGCTRKVTKKMLLKHNLRIAAWEMNIVLGLHSALVSVPKPADTGYTTVLIKDGMAIYDDNTTAITASNPPILESDQCQHTGRWRLNLDPENPNPTVLSNNMYTLRQSMSSLISQALAKLFVYTMNQRDSHQKKHSLTPSTTETTQHGQNKRWRWSTTFTPTQTRQWKDT
jgi:hypothetical protein